MTGDGSTDQGPGGGVMELLAKLPKAGPEMEALKPFHQDCTWTGKIEANGMGPGSPEMTARGQGTFRWIMDGLWVVGEFEQDQFIGEQKVLTWKAHYVAGWDHALGEYRAYVVDSNGRGSVFSGELKGDSFAIISLDEVDISDQSLKLRMVWDMSDPANPRWLNEGSLDGESWFLIEAYTMEPM